MWFDLSLHHSHCPPTLTLVSFPLTEVFGLLRVCSVCRAASQLHRVHLSSGSWDQGEVLWGDRRRLQEGTEKVESWGWDWDSAAQNVHRCLKQQQQVYAVYLCLCVSQYFKCQVFIYIYPFRGYDNWEREEKGTHFTQDIIKLILDHITICMQKGVACFIDPTENHLWAAVYHLSMPCHSLFTACFWCPRVAKKKKNPQLLFVSHWTCI